MIKYSLQQTHYYQMRLKRRYMVYVIFSRYFDNVPIIMLTLLKIVKDSILPKKIRFIIFIFYKKPVYMKPESQICEKIMKLLRNLGRLNSPELEPQKVL